MTTPNDGGPAFPNKDELGNMIAGMSLRDWFAGQMFTAIAMSATAQHTILADDETAQVAYRFADAMLKARGAKS